MFRSTTHAKLIVIASLLPIASFGIVGAISYYEINSFLDDENWVKHPYQVIVQSDAIEKTMLDIETGSRGYAITASSIPLSVFNSGVSNISGQLDSIRQLTADNPDQQSNIKKLTNLVEQKIAFSSKTVNLRNNQGKDAALQNVATLNGTNLMVQIRQVISDMKNTENNLLDQRAHTSQMSAQNSTNTIIIGTTIAIIITIISTIAVYKKMKQREEDEKTNIELHLETEKLRERDNAKAELSAMVSHELKTPLRSEE